MNQLDMSGLAIAGYCATAVFIVQNPKSQTLDAQLTGDVHELATMTAWKNGTIAEAACVFQQPWWLNAVAPNSWEEVVVRRDGHIAARMPFTRSRKMGMTVLSMPRLTPWLGPWLKIPSSTRTSQRLSAQNDLIVQLLDALPRYDLFRLALPPELTNWLPFYWNGFEQTSAVTYRISALGDIDGVWSDLDKDLRWLIKKAKKTLAVTANTTAAGLFELHRKTMSAQGRATSIDLALIERLIHASRAVGQGEIISVSDADGRLHAAAFILIDGEIAYYLIGGSDPALRKGGGPSLALWAGIEYAASKGCKIFDFEGSRIKTIERFFRGFGGQQTTYLILTGASRVGRLALALQQLRQAAFGSMIRS